jgi:hypothetical protein
MSHLTTLLRALALALVAASSSARATGTEWWVLAARLDTGDQVIVEFTLTDLGPGDRNAAAIGNWVAEDGTLTPFSRAKLEGEWTPSPDGKRIDLGKFVFDRGTPLAQLRVEKASLRMLLEFSIADAPVATRTLAGGKWTQELWVAGAPVRASLWKRGMLAPVASAGRVAVSRRRIEGTEASLAQRRLEVFSLGAAPLYALEVANGSRAERWVIACDAQGTPFAQDAAALPVTEQLSSVASSLALGGPLVSGAVRSGARLTAYDPLADVPALIRFALGLRLQSVWMASPFALDVREGARTARREGTAIASYTFYR